MTNEPEFFDWKKHDICPACRGTGAIEFDDGYDENGQMLPSYEVRCYRCVVRIGKYTQPLDVMEQLGKDVYHEAEPDNG